MSDDHLESFIRESEERIVDLNNSLLRLEDDPTDREAIDLIFRTAHTLKGNFAALGFVGGSALAHAIEDLLDEIREGRIEVTPEVMDLVFAGVDDLETIVGQIDEEGEVAHDPGPTIDELRELIESETDGTTRPDDEGEPTEDADSETPSKSVDSLLENADVEGVGGRALHVHVELAETDMQGVDAMLVLEAVEGEYAVLASVPDREGIEAGAFDAGFDLLVDAPAAADVAEILEDLSPVGEVAYEDVTGAIGEMEAGETSGGSDADAGRPRGGGPDEIKSVRVDVDQLDDLYSLVEQLVTSRIKLRRSVGSDDSDAKENLDELDKITTNLQNTVMDMRLIPLRKVVNTFPRLVRDLARDQEKEVDFEMTGTDIELDRTILDEISDPLMHVLRNAVDHGIEAPDERAEAGKPREGSIRLAASRKRDHVEIVVEDDGAGLDPDAIREKAKRTGVAPPEEVEEMADEAVQDLIFHPGFSTSEEVTDVSGRGVGMDVVRSTVSRLDGSVSVSSEPDEGTTITMELPVTMAIVRVLFIEVGDREFGLPIKAIDEITPIEGIRTVNGREMVEHGEDIYPIVDLRERLTDAGAARNGDGKLLRIRESERRVALRCDEVSRQEEVVIKPFEGSLGDVPGMSGTAVVGDGQVVPIIDVISL